jgi:hypothetical protein
VRIEAYKADIDWQFGEDGWSFGFAPRSHYHLSVRKRAITPVSSGRTTRR